MVCEVNSDLLFAFQNDFHLLVSGWPPAEQHHVGESQRAGERGGIYLFCVISLLHLFFLYALVCVSVGFEIHAMNIL